MKIKRGFAYIGGFRKFRVYLDNKTTAEVGLSKTIEWDFEQNGQIIHFETMSWEKSKKYRLTNNVEYMHVNVNPVIRLVYAIWMIFLISFAVFRVFISDEALMIVLPTILIVTILLLVGHILNRKNYIKVKAYDCNDELIELEEVPW